MDTVAAKKLVQETLQRPFDKDLFVYLLKNILNRFDEEKAFHSRGYIKEKFKNTIKTYERLGTYTDSEDRKTDLLIVYLQKANSIERARASLRNFVADYLKQRDMKDAALAAFVAPDSADWRFSFVKMEYTFNESGKVEEKFTPARRYSFLVGENENSHTAQSRLIPLLREDDESPFLENLEEAFGVETVTKEFFERYRNLFVGLKESLDEIVKKDAKIKADFEKKDIDTADFTKKFLGQIIFLYFLQKKGWFGVRRGEPWGSGAKHFLRELFNKKHGDYVNFFNDIFEPLFYEALRLERSDDYYSRFKCRIPFLNGGLFDPINDYDWVNTDILIPNKLFSNGNKTKEGDLGDGVLDVFDRYNFTVKEDEPLEKEVAVDPEMLGKVFENLLEVKDRKSKGTYYTPREIVHYMCQESLINYLVIELDGKVSKEDIEKLIKHGESVVEHDSRIIDEGRETERYSFKLPQGVRDQAKFIDRQLAGIRVCDPAVGSGAFPVGMMNEIIGVRNALTPYIGENGARSPYHFKRQAIQNCLYGVDIDPSAVEIAKLRLWLSLVVDEEERETIQPLPNLDYKIVQGNSLLSVKRDILNNDLFGELEELKPLYFNETSAEKKQQYKKQIDDLISKITNGHKDFDFEVYFSEVFHEKKGFDVVIANPPYVNSRDMSNGEQAHLRKRIRETFIWTRGSWDMYIAFFEIGFRLMNNNSVLTFITPDKWLSRPFGKEFRTATIGKISILMKAGRRVFEDASVDSIVSLFSSGDKTNVEILEFENGKFQLMRTVAKISLSTPFTFDYLFSSSLNFIRKLERFKATLSDIATCQNACATNDAYQLRPLIKELQGSALDSENLKVVNTGTIGKYYSKWGTRRMTYLRNSYKQPVVSKTRFLEIFQNSLYSRRSLQPKLIIKGLNLLDVCLDQDGSTIPGIPTLVVVNQDITELKFLLGLLNSNLPILYIKERYPASSYNQGITFTPDMINNLPVPDISENERKIIINLVNKILSSTEEDDYLGNTAQQAEVREYEKEIDQLVYNLYGLTAEEIKTVEEASSK